MKFLRRGVKPMPARSVTFTGIQFHNPFLLSSAPPTESESNILRAFEAGWGGVVTKTIGLHPVVNVVGALVRGYGARRLGLTPAAVSRTLGLLEDALGAPVFNRVGKSLVLSAAGTALRDAVRDATRTIDLGLS